MHVLQTLYALREPHWVLAGIYVSEFGEWYTVGGIAVILALWLSLRERFSLAQGVLLAVVTSGIATFILKGLIARPRPPKEFWAYGELWYSFPSAHAAISLALYGFILYIVWRTAAAKRTRLIVAFIMAVLILLIGFSRLYLGVHYLSDVLAGYLLGSACVWLGVWSERILRHGKITS